MRFDITCKGYFPAKEIPVRQSPIQMMSNGFYSANFIRRAESSRIPSTKGEKARSLRNEGERAITVYHYTQAWTINEWTITIAITIIINLVIALCNNHTQPHQTHFSTRGTMWPYQGHIRHHCNIIILPSPYYLIIVVRSDIVLFFGIERLAMDTGRWMMDQCSY